MRTFLTCLVLTLLPLCAAAQQGSVVTYSSLDYDFAVALPGGGIVGDAYSDPQWEEDETTVLRWISLREDDPVVLMMVNVVTLDAEATDDDVFLFIEGMVEGSADPGNNMSVRDISDVFTLENRGWISTLLDDTSEDASGQYEIFVTRQGQWIYAVTFYYRNGVPGGQDVAQAVLSTFVTSGG